MQKKNKATEFFVLLSTIFSFLFAVIMLINPLFFIQSGVSFIFLAFVIYSLVMSLYIFSKKIKIFYLFATFSIIFNVFGIFAVITNFSATIHDVIYFLGWEFIIIDYTFLFVLSLYNLLQKN